MNYSKLKPILIYLNHLQLQSKCKKGQVAAILVSKDLSQVYSVGINGGPKGQDDCICDSELSKFGCVHAEQNCLVKNTNKYDEKIMICTMAPCVTCAALIVNSDCNITEFIYGDDYKDSRGIDILQRAGIKCTKELSIRILCEKR